MPTPYIPFPSLLDNSAIASFKKCPLDWYYSSILSIARKGGNIHLHFGGAYAAGLEAGRKAFYDQGLSSDESICLALDTAVRYWGEFEAPEDFLGAKSLDRLVYALLEYFEQYPMESDPIRPFRLATGKSAVEFTFSIPLGIDNPDTGEPLLYGGRFDMLAEYNQSLFVEDDKTASQLGAQWMRNWILDSQFTGYCWAARDFGYPVAGAIIRGLSILKNGFGHAQAIVYRPDWQIERWLQATRHTVRLMIEYHRQSFFPPVLDKHSCNSYGGCAYHRLCESPNPDAWIAIDYEPRAWNPLAKGA